MYRYSCWIIKNNRGGESDKRSDERATAVFDRSGSEMKIYFT